MTKTQDAKKKNDELLKEIEELKLRLEELKFYEENNFEELFEVTIEVENQIETLIQSVSDLITRQSEKRQHYTDLREREVWFASSLSKMSRINKMVDKMVTEVNQM
ncbi:hypothetical protein [Sporosarcina sp. FSL K6-3457]|uniref:hypothetical protein n=1 Tax=Sporosarcina sp. FSL K6-3457 TaxID=2978204 RepID=UPI0030FC2CFC